MKHKINVTKEDIKYGAPGDCSKCAIALAVQREFPLKNVEIKTIGEKVYIDLDDKLYSFYDYNLNHKIYTFIDRFDMEYGVDPFEFELEVR